VIDAAALDPAVSPLLPGIDMLGAVITRAYVRELLGKHTYGRVLNVGAGGNSPRYRYDVRLTNTEYHTLEPSGEGNPTYVADARRMPEVPSGSYDWVLAFAVLEHVDDMHAVVGEITRVLKPGGRVYLSVPFHNELHFTRAYGDYWRVSPFGFHRLLDDDFGFEEVQYWGDCVIDPVTIGVIARKGAQRSAGTSRLYYVEGGLDSIHRYVDGAKPLRWSVPISRLKMDGLEYCLQVQDFRAKIFRETGQALTLRAVDRLLFEQVAIPEATLLVSNEWSRLERVS
jgi:SAM-dependent methyltransferase